MIRCVLLLLSNCECRLFHAVQVVFTGFRALWLRTTPRCGQNQCQEIRANESGGRVKFCKAEGFGVNQHTILNKNGLFLITAYIPVLHEAN